MRASLVIAAVLAAAPLGAQQPAFHVSNYDLTLDLPLTGKVIVGKADLTVIRRARADTLVLDLLDLTVKRVSVGGSESAFARDAAHVRVPLGGRIGDSIHVVVEYGGEVKDGLIVGIDSAGRWMAFGDNWPNRARHWLPSIDHPSDKATVSWNVRAPSDRKVVANGTLLAESPLPLAAGSPAAPRTLTRWRESHPIPVYLMTIAAAPLAQFAQ